MELKLLKTFEYKGEKYEIMKVEKNGRIFLQDYKNGQPFSIYPVDINDTINNLSKLIGCEVVEGKLLSLVEENILFWDTNSDRILRNIKSKCKTEDDGKIPLGIRQKANKGRGANNPDKRHRDKD
ncbi:MAG: hypothetical protein WC374_11030 [Phycisphaerae bacterium]|jgi:hypothetical protein